MKYPERQKAIALRESGLSIKAISQELGVAKSSVSVWVRDVTMPMICREKLKTNPFSSEAVEKRRLSRLRNEKAKRDAIENSAKIEISNLTTKDLWLMGVMLYWAEGGKTQRMVRFSNGDPEMIRIMMKFFRIICKVPEAKFRGYIHIHPHLDVQAAELYWSDVSNVPVTQFFKTYQKINVSSKNRKDTLPHGVMDVYVMDSALFLRIRGWAKGIFSAKLIG